MKIASTCLSLLIATMSCVLVASPVLAKRGLTVSGVLMVVDVSPGETVNHRIDVSIGDEGPATEIQVTVAPIGQSPDGTYVVIEEVGSDARYSAASFVTVDRASFPLAPGETQTVLATAVIPKDIGQGGRYAIINVQTRAVGQAGVGVASAVNIPVCLTVANTSLIHQGEITGLAAGEPTSGKPVEILTSFKNTGNHHFKVKGEVTIMDAAGKTLDTVHTSLGGTSIIPSMVRHLKATYVPQGNLTPGIYTVRSKVMLEDGTVLDETVGSFDVNAPYVPPPPPASVTLKPSAPGTLRTTDGRITIEFPRGAVLDEAIVALRGCPPEQLPSPPAGFLMGSTAFRVDGLTGLLAQRAFVSVRYSSSDLDKAGGDISRLVLARWDEGRREWSVLKTRVAKDNSTLTTSTDRFSIWTIMAKETGGGGIGTVQIVIIGGILAACLGIVVVASRKRRS